MTLELVRKNSRQEAKDTRPYLDPPGLKKWDSSQFSTLREMGPEFLYSRYPIACRSNNDNNKKKRCGWGRGWVLGWGQREKYMLPINKIQNFLDSSSCSAAVPSPSPPPPCPRGLTFTWWGCCGSCQRHKPIELVHSFLFCFCVYSCLHDPFNCISFHEFSRQLSAFLLCSSGLISALLVLSTIHLFMKVSLSPDIILCC